MRNKNIIAIALATGCILLVPLVAMQLSDEWNWSLFDFVFMGALLLGTGLTYEFVASRPANIAYRLAVGVAVLTALLLVWVNAAVGIIGDDNPANAMYLAVPAVGCVGAVAARLRPPGMARALFATALAQMLIPVMALVFWNPGDHSWAPGVLPVFVLNACFASLFVASALLFQRASATGPARVAI